MVKVSGCLAAFIYTACALSLPVDRRQVTCVSGLYIISARGSNEDTGEGSLSQVSTLIKNAVPGSVSVAVDYPAAIINAESIYPVSLVRGIVDTLDKITTYVDTCGASSRIVLLGYSQGAHVMMDALSSGFGKPPPLSEEYRPYVSGIAVFGDPSFTAGESFNAGTATRNGIFSRPAGSDSMALLRTYSGVMRSYCDANDIVCAGGLSQTVHTNEVVNHAQEAAEFIVSLVQ